MSCRLALSALLVLCGGSALWGQPKGPPPPAEYDAVIRYRIDAPRNQRAGQFLDMMNDLKRLKFERDKRDAARGEDLDEIVNPAVDFLAGTIPSSSVEGLLKQRHIQTVLLVPKGKALPAD